MLRIAKPMGMGLCSILLLGCTFGSIADREEEKLTILQNLIFFNNNRTVPLQTNVRSFDDQGDTNLSTFILVSNGVNYEISIQTSSIVWEEGRYRINPPNQFLGISTPGSTRTHTPFTLPLDLPANDLYGKFYSFLDVGPVSNLTIYNSDSETGASFLYPNTRIVPSAPIGVIASAELYWEEILLRLHILRASDSTSKTVNVLIPQGFQRILPKCKIPVSETREFPIEILFRISALFQDRTVAGTPVRFLQDLFLVSGSTVDISIISNPNLLTILQNNLRAEDFTFQFPGCFPGVER